jgi:hypothetical protein
MDRRPRERLTRGAKANASVVAPDAPRAVACGGAHDHRASRNCSARSASRRRGGPWTGAGSRRSCPIVRAISPIHATFSKRRSGARVKLTRLLAGAYAGATEPGAVVRMHAGDAVSGKHSHRGAAHRRAGARGVRVRPALDREPALAAACSIAALVRATRASRGPTSRARARREARWNRAALAVPAVAVPAPNASSPRGAQRRRETPLSETRSAVSLDGAGRARARAERRCCGG